jgi:ActR/RegA family two-component response regulator
MPEDLPREVREQRAYQSSSNQTAPSHFNFSDQPTLEEIKKRYVHHVLQITNGNVSATARILNVDRRSLYRMLARYKIGPSSSQD